MSNTEEKFVINKKNISNYTTGDRDILLKNIEKNKDGFPVCWPTVNKKNSQVFISFVDAIICNPKGEQIYDEVGNFDILEKTLLILKIQTLSLKSNLSVLYFQIIVG